MLLLQLVASALADAGAIRGRNSSRSARRPQAAQWRGFCGRPRSGL